MKRPKFVTMYVRDIPEPLKYEFGITCRQKRTSMKQEIMDLMQRSIEEYKTKKDIPEDAED